MIACVASQVLKDGHPKLGLVQRAISILLYGNGSPKKVREKSMCVPRGGFSFSLFHAYLYCHIFIF